MTSSATSRGGLRYATRADELGHTTSPTSSTCPTVGSFGRGSRIPSTAARSAPRLWSHILRAQLCVSEEDFWTCGRAGAKPNRGVPEPPSEALPADLVHLLITRVGLAESRVAAMSKAEAVERLNRYWTE